VARKTQAVKFTSVVQRLQSCEQQPPCAMRRVMNRAEYCRPRTQPARVDCRW